MNKLRNMTSIYLRRGDKFLLLYRVGSKVIGNSYTGTAGGHMEASELNNPRACVLRELQEETGLKAEKMEMLSHIVTTPGFCTEKIGLFLATGLSQHETHLDEDEFLQVKRIPLSEAVDQVMRGEIRDAKSALGLLMAWQKLHG